MQNEIDKELYGADRTEKNLKIFNNITMMIKVFLSITIIQFIYYLLQYIINSEDKLAGQINDKLIYEHLYYNLTGNYNLDVFIHNFINFLRYMAWQIPFIYIMYPRTVSNKTMAVIESLK